MFQVFDLDVWGSAFVTVVVEYFVEMLLYAGCCPRGNEFFLHVYMYLGLLWVVMLGFRDTCIWLLATL